MIQGDSIEYDMLKLACDSLTGDDLFTCEIGVRQGEGSKIISELVNIKEALSDANNAKIAPIIWWKGAPGGWPIWSFAEVEIYSPASQ